MSRVVLVSIVSVFVWSSLTSPSAACGGFFCEPQQPVLQAGENIAFGVTPNEDDGTIDVSMVVQINYEGPAEGFGWLLPVPKLPELSVGSDLLFRGLFEQSRPTFQFTIDNSASTTCSQEALENQECPAFAEGVEADEGGEIPREIPDSEVVIERGTVGPFEFVILQAEESKPETIFDWLEQEGFDQPEGSRPLVNYYASMGMYFVALRLEKQNDAGDIRPIIMDYTMDGNLAEDPVACVPIQLTGIAATPNMPIQIYVLAPHRAFPLNYFHVTLDTSMIDWIRCSQQGQNCYLNDWRDNLQSVLDDVGGYGFTTEYAGPASIVSSRSIALDPSLNLQQLREMRDSVTYLQLLNSFGVPSITAVNSIIDKYITNTLPSASDAPPACQNLENVLDVVVTDQGRNNFCIGFLNAERNFRSEQLTNELEEKVFQPAREAVEWLRSFGYLTRLYGQLSPEQMDRDPFFAFNPELPDIARRHTAVGVPECDGEDVPIGMTITADDTHTLFVDASLSCGAWFPFGGDDSVSPAVSLEAYDYLGGTTGRVLNRSEQTGQYSSDDIESIISFLDERVPDQTIPPFNDPQGKDDDDDSASTILSKMISIESLTFLSATLGIILLSW